METKLVKSQQNIFKKLNKLMPFLKDSNDYYFKLKASGYMDLSVDILSKSDETITIALSHYFEQNGDLIPDPDITMEVDFKEQTVLPLAYQDSFGYRSAVVDDKPVEKAVKDLLSFLNTWLSNLANQGHKIA